jgi:hypothetical protein
VSSKIAVTVAPIAATNRNIGRSSADSPGCARRCSVRDVRRDGNVDAEYPMGVPIGQRPVGSFHVKQNFRENRGISRR